MSEKFQKIVLKASNAGTLISSRVLLNIWQIKYQLKIKI
jgi:hypothetical protein